MRQAFTLAAIQRQYLQGVPDPGLVSPDGWLHDYVQLSRPGNDQIQLALFADYATNLLLYPKLHDWLRDRQIPVLAVWGRNDEIFGPAGALAFADDSANTEIHLLNGAHFLLESHLDDVAALIRPFLERTAL
jgi:pimeloyl-ACP methyl ester carboxylesterase